MQIFINTYGTYLHVREEMFEIKVKNKTEGSPKVSHLAAKKVTSFVLSKGVALSTDAIALALKHNIDIVVLENHGHPMGRFWHSKLGSTTKIRKRQLEVSINAEGVNWVKLWLTKKLENQADYIQDLKKHRKELAFGLTENQEKILHFREKIASLEAPNVKAIAETLRGLEGSAGRQYFDALSTCIPTDFAFSGRSYRPAKDEFNAMLNYGYGILYSKVEKALMLAGLDPYVGFLHRDDYNMKSLVFDFIEPYRIFVEHCVFRLFSRKRVKKAHFVALTNGISLNDDGKPFFVSELIQYLEEDKVKYKGKNHTRANVIQLEAHRFANTLIE